MRIKRLAILLAGIGLPTASQAATQGFALSSFQAIRVEAPVRLVVQTGRGASASAEGDRRVLDRLALSVNGDILTIRLAPAGEGAGATASGPIVITVSTDRVNKLLITGSGVVEIDRMTGERGTIDMAGAGSVKVGTVALDRLALTLSGSGQARLAGSARIAEVGLTGAGTIDAAGLIIGQLSLIAEGSGNVTLNATGSADIKALGAGDVVISGKPACKVTHNGGGRVMCGGVER